MLRLWFVGWLSVAHGEEPLAWESPSTPVLSAKALGLPGLRASDCGSCHTTIYEEWKVSVHAAAWVDPQFQAELHKDPQVSWVCLNCHTPVSNQQRELVNEGGTLRSPFVVSNPVFDSQLQEEGVTCLACHWRPSGIASAHKDVRAPHATVYDPNLASDASCERCHQARARLDDALVCHFNTGDEKRAAGVQKTCSSCHMPSVQRPAVIGGPLRMVGRHQWPGSGIGKGHAEPVEGLNGLDINASWNKEAGRIQVSLSNSRAGHKIPTGDPERAIEVRMKLLDESGTALETQVERIGQEWVWSPVAKQLSDNRIQVGETRRLTWSPSGHSNAATIEVEVFHVRLSQANLQYHLELIRSGHPGPTEQALQAYPTERRLFREALSL